ncbi:YpdA family putative bacillithiol disulfide reductase [Leeuwenhoekiella marinoflava]|uniref:Thioredoxin reductase (NADPH) n=2 Tax=Leeuwenhoekiella marinoflava TaxID=988 RepID=A0A4Q0PLZ5_9FLAO|nr:YpdA family putative bacillithiol disulfide reductase [Leeuwenhoekiella marinoflava]RXG28349.1 thioredoxin reductase (NADPH) [Leeuwenhoekiella marinoflava]SHF55419.1 thioredoxin reductase (NADPH) [Leeuwenhoekiella marinoflava DSM 3653]
MKNYDLIIVGGGPIGLACGIAATKAKLNYIILEKGVLVNSLYNFPEQMTFFSTSNLLEIGDVPFVAHNDKPTRKEALEYYRRVYESWKLNIQLYTPVSGMQQTEDGYILDTPKGQFKTKAVIVSTGFYDTARKLNIPGEDLPKVKHFYDSPHPYVNQKLLVIGAANSACDVALETYYKGAEVTMAIRSNEIYPKTKYWIKPNIENRIKEGSIKAYFETSVTEIKSHSVVLNTPEGEVEIENDFVLAMIGYMPDYSLFENLGIPVDEENHKKPIHNPETLETPLPNVYVAGVINSGLKTSKLFIENTRVHADMILEHLKAKIGQMA